MEPPRGICENRPTRQASSGNHRQRPKIARDFGSIFRVSGIYKTRLINDNFGRWRSDFRQQVEHCLKEDCPDRKIVALLAPDEDDYFVLKPMHSGFYSTTLDVLLRQLGVRSLYLCGFAADLCVLYTANDAYMRGYELAVPADCTASESAARYRFALEHIKSQLKADVRESTKVRFR